MQEKDESSTDHILRLLISLKTIPGTVREGPFHNANVNNEYSDIVLKKWIKRGATLALEGDLSGIKIFKEVEGGN